MALTLGAVPDDLTLVLTPGADFNHVLDSTAPGSLLPDPIPGGAVVDIRIGTPVQYTWVATVATETATFSVDKVEVQLVLDAIGSNLTDAKLFYAVGSVEVCLASGVVEIHG